MTPDPAMTEAAELVAGARHVFVLTGAGMSTESGVPDFRGPNGLWTRDPHAARMFDLDAYRSDRDLRVRAWRMRMASEIRDAEPNRGHRALADWQAADRRATVATQNIDGLHQRAGSSTVLELHGSYWESMCLSCDERLPVEQTFQRVMDGDEDPACLNCGGILKTGTVAFGQSLPRDTWQSAVAAAAEADVALAVGTTLAVHPAASLCDVAVRSGAPLVIVNSDPTPYDAVATVVLRGRIGHVLPTISPGPTARG